MKMKKVCTLLISGVILLSAASCQGQKNDSDTQINSQSTEAAAGNGLEKKLSFSVGSFEIGVEDENGNIDPLYEEMAKRFNVDITPITINWDTWDEQINTMMASGDLPDVARYNFTPDKYGYFLDMVEQEAIRSLPALDKYPNLARVRQTMPIADMMTVNDELFAWPVPRQDNPYSRNSSLGIIYRRDWAKKVGLYKENDEYTIDEFLALARAFRDQDPGGNGAGKTVPYAEVGWGFGFLSQGFNPHNTYTKIDDTYVWSQSLPGAVEAVSFYNNLYKEGLYYQDFYAAKDYDARSLYYANMVGIYMDNLSLAGLDKDIIKPFAKANPDLDVNDATAVMYVKGSDGKFFTGEMENTWSATIFNQKLDDEKMDRILTMMDWAATEEGLQTYCYGLEGIDWEKENGEVKVLWKKDDEGNYIQPVYSFSQFREVSVLSGDFGPMNPNISDAAKESIQNFQMKFTEDNADIIKLDYDVDYLNAPNKNKYGTFNQDTAAELKRMIVSSTNVEEDMGKWVESMMPKVQSVLDELNAELK